MASQILPRSELVATLKAGLQRCSKTLLIAGIALIVLGTVAIIAPGIATLFVTTFIGWLFILVGRGRVLPGLPGPWRLAHRRGACSPAWSRWSPAPGCC